MRTSAGWVVLSPHLDDAVLSLGAQIARRRAAGLPVEVWTAFTRAPRADQVPRRLRAFADYEVRLAEDDRALDVLDAGRRRLDLPERVWRPPSAHGLAAAFRTPAERSGFAALLPLREVVAQALDRPDVQVLAPLGIGHHVDHVEVALALLEEALHRDQLDRVAFYEDFYALGSACRRQHPVTGPTAGSRARAALTSPGWAAPVEGLVLRVTAAVGSGPSLDTYVPIALSWGATVHPLDADDERRQLSAIAEYRSQTPALGGMVQLRRLLRRAHRLRAGDLIWSAQPR